ncbi:hypothetical protein BD410DRAFT_781624 [Rickenella mellea]|uniref:Uncharacterized protein n=1 Tax=Rickenella mellea TaxID=50990 RepID=A0A4Y7QKG2_9AGAM|nr:hypothetical protein BD410DRAFT_781624 [Rickenella mellea]
MVMNTEVAAYLRVSSLAIALFDFVQTIPGELRLYSQQSSIRHLSPGCILFILVRYISVAALITSSIGFFGSGFSKNDCHHFFLVAPTLKLLATLVSQIIISVRTYAVSRKSLWVKWILVVMFLLALVPEILGNDYRRVISQTAQHNCTSGNLPGAKIAWLHYLAAMIFDAVACGIATWYIFAASAGLTMMGGFAKMMLGEGLIYFIALTGVNILNLILFRTNNFAVQSSATTLGQAITMIFSQKFILNLSDSAFERSSREDSVRFRDTPRGGIRPYGGSSFLPTFASRGGKSFNGEQSQNALEIGIRVEKDIMMDDLSPYGDAKMAVSPMTTDSFTQTKGVSWESHAH